MAVNTSGPIYLSTVQNEVGGANPIYMDEYYKDGAYLPSPSYSNWYTPFTGTYSAAPTSGSIYMSNLYGADPSKQWSYSTSPVNSGYSTSNSTTFNINSYLSNLSTGVTFAVCTSFHPSTAWQHGEDPTLVCTYGTAASLSVPHYWDKQWVLTISYDGGSTVTIGGYYQYKSTNNPNGGAYLKAVGRL